MALKKREGINRLVKVVHVFNYSTWNAKAGSFFMSSKPVWSTL